MDPLEVEANVEVRVDEKKEAETSDASDATTNAADR